MLKKTTGYFLMRNDLLIIIAAILGVTSANFFFQHQIFFYKSLKFNIGCIKFHFSLRQWINDFSMAIFFFLIGIKIKFQVLQGSLKDRRQVLLPVASALVGSLLPMCIYMYITYNDKLALRGFAVPSATDIAFAVGAYNLFFKNAPLVLKVFLTVLAIVDDLVAILMVALFYSKDIDINYLILILCTCIFLFMLNKLDIVSLMLYLTIGLCLWFFCLNSGLHPTVSGTMLAIFIPCEQVNNKSLVQELENKITLYIEYLIQPIFVFVNCMITIDSFVYNIFFHPIVKGVIFGLLFGKILGISFTVWSLTRLKFIILNSRVKLTDYYLVSIFCAIGFTMSLFINSTAFLNYHKYECLAKVAVIVSALFTIVVIFMIKLLYKVSIYK